jgi:hypothetical protein
MRQGMPVQYTYNSAPAHAVFLQGTDATLASVTNTSSLVIHDVRTDFALAEIQPLQQQIPAEVRCVASSPSSQMIAVGDDAGGFHVWTNYDVTKGGTIMPRNCLYDSGTVLEVPPTHPPPPTISIAAQSLPWYMMDGGVPEEVMRYERINCGEGAMYTLNRPPLMPYTPSQLLSGMPQGIGKATHKPRPARCIHPVLLECTKYDDDGRIGYIDMSAVQSSKGISFETKGSGLLFGRDKRNAYVEADPRVRTQINIKTKYQRMELGNGDVVYVDIETGIQVDRPPQHLKRVNMQKNTYGKKILFFVN